jgi:hypothetical protein
MTPLTYHFIQFLYFVKFRVLQQDVGYYALGSLNLSKLCVPCTFEFLILVTPQLQLTASGVSLGGRGGKRPTSRSEEFLSVLGSGRWKH